MKKLDWYILRQYLGTYIFVVLVFVTIICVIDFTEKNDDFMQENVPVTEVIFDYYANLYPYFINFLSPVMIFISTILVTSKMASHTEVIAILSSGVSLLRFMWSFMMGAIIVGAFTFLMLGWIIPKANAVRIQFELKYFEPPQNTRRDTHLQIAPNVFAYASRYSTHVNSAHDFTLEKIVDKVLVEKLSADHAIFDTTTSKWNIRKYTLRTYVDSVETLSVGRDMDTTLNLYPSDFTYEFKFYETLTLPEVDDYIEELKFRGLPGVEEYIREKYERLTYPFAILVLTALGVLVSARKSRQGVGSQIVLGIVLALLYIMFLLLGRNFTQSDFMHPLFNAWLPNIVFSIVGVILYRTLPK